MTSAGARQQQLSALSATGTGDEPASSTSNDTESYIRGLRSPQHNSYEDMIFQMRESRDRDRRQSDLAMEVLEAPSDTELKPANPQRKIDVSPQLRAQDKMQALTDVVTHIREVRDTINLTMSEAAYGEHQDEDSDEIEEFNDMYSEITSIRDALESSVSNFDAALANATNVAPAMYYSGPSDRSQDSLRDGGSDHGAAMSAEQFNSVARITFAAARATRQAGQAFLSTFSDAGERQTQLHDATNDHNNQEEHEHDGASASSASVASYPTVYDSDDSSAQSPDPYSALNYEKIMATYQPEHDGSEHDDDDDARSHNFANSVRRATEIHELEKKIRDLQRSLEDAQRKLSVIDSDEPEPEARSRQRLEAARDRSAQMEIESVFEIFGERGDEKSPILGDASSSVSSGPRAMSLPSDAIGSRGLTTQELVSELRGVMASSETPVRASGGSRKSVSRSSTPPLPPTVTKAPISPPPPPPPPMSPLRAKKQVSPDYRMRHSFSKLTKPANGELNNSHGSTKKTQAPGPNRPSASPTEGSYLQALGTTGGTRYGGDDDYASSSSDEESFDDSSDDLSLLSSDDFREPQFKKYQGPDAFYVEEDLNALLKKRKAEAGASPPVNPADSPSSPLPPAPAVGRDERDELRELMAGLVRPRSSSLPFQSSQMGGASSGEPHQDYDKPSWSDDAPDRTPTAHQVEEAVREIRACLASCRCECPSDTERARKLTSIFKVLRSLHREGVRSKFRTLQHDDIRYSKMLKATPSIIKLLKLAGYVSLQQKLTMRRVDQDYLALFLRELEQELHSSTVA
ncbi:hypothetical protein ON010_g9847 [Phytophthora cinnamomi]|nr:hypothetical protein ON010_g9847 [Phytophthora cinnamomi]